MEIFLLRVTDGLVFCLGSVSVGILEAMSDWDTDIASCVFDLLGFYDTAGLFYSGS